MFKKDKLVKEITQDTGVKDAFMEYKARQWSEMDFDIVRQKVK